jgi:hypothetical protein
LRRIDHAARNDNRAATPEAETKTHQAALAEMRQRHPKLAV